MSRSPLLSLIVLLFACGAPPDPASDAGSVDASVVSPLPLPFYEVPVADDALAAHAFFAVPDVHYVAAGGIVTLTYDFPADLSGIVDQEVVLSGPVDAAGNAEISGAVGSGTCTVEAGVVRCLERFTALPMDLPAAHAMAASYSTIPATVDARRAVLAAFGADPIGIVVFDLATASEPIDD